MIRSLYDLMGQNINPPADEQAKNQHIESVIEVSRNSKFIILYIKILFIHF
jgi:hypothetical protein